MSRPPDAPAPRPSAPGGRVPPHSLEAEAAVLGGILLDNEAIHSVREKLAPEDFYRQAHAKVFGAMADLSDRHEPTDIVTLTAVLRDQGVLEAIGGVSFLTQLVDSVASAANIESHVKIVKEKALLRRVIRVSSEIAVRGYEDVADIDEFLNESERTFMEISGERVRTSYDSMSTVVKEGIRMIDALAEKGGEVSGVPTGFTRIDEKTLGLQKSDLIIIAGRPSMGKTSFALGIAEHAAIRENRAVAIFSLEMSKVQLGLRMLSSQSQVDAWKIRRGLIGQSDWERLLNAADRLSRAPIFIDDTAALSVLELNAKSRRLKREHDIGLILIDYLQLMRGRSRSESREKEISDISQSLKALAKEIDVPVVALSQLNRRVEERTDKRPMLSDLRESGAIEQDADVIMFIYRDEFYRPKTSEKPGIAEIIIGKQRNGPIGEVELAFNKDRSSFENLEANWQEVPAEASEDEPPFPHELPPDDPGPPPDFEPPPPDDAEIPF